MTIKDYRKKAMNHVLMILTMFVFASPIPYVVLGKYAGLTGEGSLVLLGINFCILLIFLDYKDKRKVSK